MILVLLIELYFSQNSMCSFAIYSANRPNSFTSVDEKIKLLSKSNDDIIHKRVSVKNDIDKFTNKINCLNENYGQIKVFFEKIIIF